MNVTNTLKNPLPPIPHPSPSSSHRKSFQIKSPSHTAHRTNHPAPTTTATATATMKYDLNLSLTTPPAEPPTELPTKQLSVGEPTPRPPSRKHSSSQVPTLSTPFDDAALSTEGSRSPASPVPAPTTTSRDEVTPPPAATLGGVGGTPLCTIHEDRKLAVSGADWLMGKPWGSQGKQEGEGEKEDVKTATGSEPPRKPKGPRREEDGHLVNGNRLIGDWMLPSAGVGEWMDSEGNMRVPYEIEEAMRNTPAPVFMRRSIDRMESELVREAEEERLRHEQMLRETEGERVAETDQEKEERWEMERRRRIARGWVCGGGGGGGGGGGELEDGEPYEEEEPEEANEYTPSGAAPPEMIAAARARAEARWAEARWAEEARAERVAARKAAARRAEVAAREAAAVLAAAEPALDPAATEAARRLKAAERARKAVENEPHSPSWNGSTYIDGREHHYCGPDFPCQMEPVCDPSIKEIWEKGLPIAPDEMPPKRVSFTGPMRALFGFKKGQPVQKYRKPVSIQSIRVGNSAETTVIEEPRSDAPLGSGRRTSRAGGEAEKGDRRTMRGLRKVWGFWTHFGGKMGGRRGVVVTKSEESLPVAEGEEDTDMRYNVADAIAASAATANLAASACYPVGESTVETAKVVERTDSGTVMDGV
ncbi:hypothetical protein VC83_03980 [Pseudogymnoascus destructans]|uniref:Uncharacterized protein n=1 Tax=Pseudogymnoascus destructans TaxID=655981 RepID=A0A177ABY9_9PEZI|nr:uncharacterized protein VC83_03980 [Pseudogymnoascus destructans]OAF59629.1 hypothetical protein VC83_03980 [Pseudogymnoascus destructans]